MDEIQDEILDIVNSDGVPVAKATRVECHNNPDLMHPVVHLHLFDPVGRIYLQKRSVTKDLLPGYWDTAVGGHIASGEESRQALMREAEEELGVDASGAEFLYNYIWKGIDETEYVYGFKLIYTGLITPDGDEVDEGRFFTFEEISLKEGKGGLTPNFEYEFNNYLKNTPQRGEKPESL